MKIGQTVYLRPIGNAARCSTEIREVVITRVGRKYFQVDPSYLGRFEIESMMQDGKGYTPDYQAYLSKEAVEQEDEFKDLLSEIQKVFRGYGNHGITFDQAKAIGKILGISIEDINMTKVEL